MNLRSTLATAFFILIAIGAVNAQDSFVKGYYLLTPQDTVRGFIEYRSDDRNFRMCVFKKSLDMTAEVFYPDDIIAFNIDDKVSYVAQSFKGFNEEKINAFFKVVVGGRLSLLNYDKRYFALTQQNELLEVTRIKTDASGRPKENFQGFGALKILMSDCPTTNQEWLLKQYSDTNLEKIFITYNQCVNSPVTVIEKVASGLALKVGLQVLGSAVIVNARYPVDGVKTPNNVTPGGGLYLSVSNSRKWGGVSVRVEADYYQYAGSGHVVVNSVPYDVTVKYGALQLPLLFRAGRNSFLDFGLSNQLLIHQDLSMHSTSPTYTKDYKGEKLSAFSAGIVLGGGTTFNIGSVPLQVLARYSRNGSSFGPRYEVVSIGLSFQLTKNQK